MHRKNGTRPSLSLRQLEVPCLLRAPRVHQDNQNNQNNQDNQDNAAEKKATRAQFKVDWCEDRDIDPQNMSDKQVGSMMASFTVYWNQLNKGQV